MSPSGWKERNVVHRPASTPSRLLAHVGGGGLCEYGVKHSPEEVEQLHSPVSGHIRWSLRLLADCLVELDS